MKSKKELTEKEILIAPHQIAIDITNKCNLRCLHCYNQSGENIQSCNELTDEEVLRFIDELCEVGIFNLCFCGGEPLLRKDLIIECIKKLRKANVANVSMVTNGLLLNKEIAIELKEVGITNIQLSLDGATPETHDRLRNKKGAFDSAIRAIEILLEVGLKPNIAFTPTSFNIHELKDVHDLLRKYELFDIDFRTQPLMLMGRASDNLDSINPSYGQYRKMIKDLNKINMENKKPYITWGDPVDHLIRFSKRNLCVNQCVIRSNGDIVASTYLPLVVGNIKRHSFLEYWNFGLSSIWDYKVPIEIAKTIKCIEDMNNTNENLPVVWKDKDIYIDLIDQDLNDLSLIK